MVSGKSYFLQYDPDGFVEFSNSVELVTSASDGTCFTLGIVQDAVQTFNQPVWPGIRTLKIHSMFWFLWSISSIT